ncbi:MAG: YlxR family protein [Clostridium sp.]|nr:YlxR family protein [Clostridium sp.]MCM1444620.1 YlxR family protein [Candidatus Amulumruptor caecigallinarius]
MKPRKIPMRTCVVTKEKLPKQELIRVVRTPEGNVIIDEKGKANGRGAYLKKDIDVYEKAKKTKILSKHLEIEVPDSIFEDLKNLSR